MKYPEYKSLDLPNVAEQVLVKWKAEKTFEQSIEQREGATPFVFYEGPPSANGMPGIHHVMARTIKDIFCRYKTQKGFQVNRKAGWDTHGLPVELAVEKELGITKEDIGTKISVEEYNQKCREAVMRFTNEWETLTEKMGYWVDTESPYVTYHNKYIETVWWLLKQLYKKDLLYKGYSVQPYSPAAGTGLSSHELNMPGCYRPVKDTSVTAQFKVIPKGSLSLGEGWGEVFFLAWTTTPWTLPSNCALAVGEKIAYSAVKTYNPYTHKKITVILAKDLLSAHFDEKARETPLSDYKEGDKLIPWEVCGEFSGKELEGIKYKQLFPYAQPDESEGEAFRVIIGDFVSTDDGTGIVHTASVFGADDFRICQQNNVPAILVTDENGNKVPLVDKQGRFRPEVTDWPGYYLKPEYEPKPIGDDYKPTDVLIAIKLKEENKAFKVEKYEHSYPHCWRTDKPILYYPLDSWFVRASAAKEKMSTLNDTINWKPAHTGTGRFGEWLSNLHDWNLSRSRYWGIPLPIWKTEDGSEEICIGSVEQLQAECEKAVAAGAMKENPIAEFSASDFSEENYNTIDLHRPFVDDIVLVSSTGKPMCRETDLIDVWFDSGSMPYAQVHYPFENKELIDGNKAFPADFIAEGVDQTRGWFYTLHAIAAMCFDSVAYKNVISNGLVLDKQGQKMSKRLGNAIDPFTTLEEFGPDSTRWYMITNSQPWDNLKFDLEGINEVQRKFFRALYNSYAFFALYANLDEFKYSEPDIALSKRKEIDCWVLSRLNSLIKEVDAHYNEYEPTKAGRAIQDFVVDELSNWYVRQCRKRFWRGDYTEDKIAAYQTLYRCLEVVAQLSAPIAPFYAEQLFSDLNSITGRIANSSVHLAALPKPDENKIDKELEERMGLAQKISSMVLALRKKEQIKVRQPLQKIMVPVQSKKMEAQLEAVKNIILTEINVKELEVLDENSNVLVKEIKPNFKSLGPKYGKYMKAIAAKVDSFEQEEIITIEKEGNYNMDIEGETLELELSDFEINSKDIPGLLVASENGTTVALDISVTDELKDEGIAREFVNRIQNMRKEQGFEVSDRINLLIKSHDKIDRAINANLNYICSETLANSLQLVENMNNESGTAIEVEEGVETVIALEKLN